MISHGKLLIMLELKQLHTRQEVYVTGDTAHTQRVGVCCLMTPGLSKDIRCHA